MLYDILHSKKWDLHIHDCQLNFFALFLMFHVYPVPVNFCDSILCYHVFLIGSSLMWMLCITSRSLLWFLIKDYYELSLIICFHKTWFQLGRIITTVEGAGALSESPEVIRQTVKLIADEDMSVASAAVNFLSDYGCTSPNIARTLLSHDPESSLETLKAVMSKSDAIRYRVFEVSTFKY